MRICMVHINSRGYPTDVRIAPEVKSLLRAGHEVAVFTYRRSGEPREEVCEGTRVVRFDIKEDFRGSALRRKLITLVDKIHFFNSWWRAGLVEVCRDYDAIHVHDLPYVRTAVSAGRILGKPVIFDMHENYPSMIELAFDSGDLRKNKNIPYLFGRLRKYELEACRSVDYIITVVEESRNRLISLGIPPEKIIIVENTMDREIFEDAVPDQKLVEEYEDRFVITYLGGISELRGIGTVIEALPAIAEKIPNVLFLVVGAWENDLAEEKFRKLADELDVAEMIKYTGLVAQETIPSYLSVTNIGLIPHQLSELTNSTLPHKLFDHMLMKNPVIVTECAPLKRIVEESGCGIVIPERRSDCLAEAVVALSDKDTAIKIGENGYSATHEKYNWDVSVKPLLSLYSKSFR